jgi:2-polyprenyl-3-methyl-5-hydroxy-6-metoxy-1,4-benzoquinol methylase
MKNMIDRFEEDYFKNIKNWYGRKVPYSYFEVMDKRMTEFMLKDIDVKNKQVLIVGVGYGYEAEVLQEKGAIITGIDISKYAINECNRRLHGKFFVQDIEEPLPEHKYDVVFAMEVLEHLKNPISALSNMYDSLKEGGIIIMATPNGRSPYSIYDRQRDKTHVGIRTSWEWEKMMEHTGFENIKIKCMQWIPFIWRLISLPIIGNALIMRCEKNGNRI